MNPILLYNTQFYVEIFLSLVANDRVFDKAKGFESFVVIVGSKVFNGLFVFGRGHGAIGILEQVEREAE